MVEELVPFAQALRVLKVSCAELQAMVARGELQLFSYEGVNMFRRADILALKERTDQPCELVAGRKS